MITSRGASQASTVLRTALSPVSRRVTASRVCEDGYSHSFSTSSAGRQAAPAKVALGRRLPPWQVRRAQPHARALTSSASASLPSDDPGGKPIPTDGSYRTVYDDFNNILAGEEQQLSVHSMGDSTFTMTDGLVAHTPIMMINKQVLLWDAPPLGGKDEKGNDILVMPTGRGWEAWTDDVWRVFEVVQPRPEILIFGTGKTVLPVPQHVKRYLNKLGIQIEAHSSRNACSTYNMLAEEERLVAAAILPDKRKPTERIPATENAVESA